MPIAATLNQAETRWFSFVTSVLRRAFEKPSFPVVQMSHPLAQGLRFCAPFCERFGNKLNDILYGRTGSFNGNVAFTANQGSTALTFDGTGDYIEFASSPQLDITGNAVTIACGIRFSTSQSNKVLVAKWGGTTQYLLYIDNAAADKIRLNVNAGGSTANITSTNTYNDGVIHNIVASYDGANLNLYIDGQQVASAVAKTGNLASTAELLRLGLYSSSGGDYTGEMNYAYIWNRGLSQFEAAWLNEDPYAFVRPDRDMWFLSPSVATVVKFRKTLSSVGTGVGKRQCHS